MMQKFIAQMCLVTLVVTSSSSVYAGILAEKLGRTAAEALYGNGKLYIPKPGIHFHPEYIPKPNDMVKYSPAIGFNNEWVNYKPRLLGYLPKGTTKQYLMDDTFLEDIFPYKKALIRKHGIKLNSISVTETEEEFPIFTQKERREKRKGKIECSTDAAEQFVRHLFDEMHVDTEDIWKAIRRASQKTCINDIKVKCEYRRQELTFNFNIRNESLTITPGFKYKFGPHLEFEGKAPTLELESSSNQLPHGNICQQMTILDN